MSIEPGIYRHFKGGLYEVSGLVRHSETEEWLVLYRPCSPENAQWWVRPLEMFVEKIEREGQLIRRFEWESERP